MDADTRPDPLAPPSGYAAEAEDKPLDDRHCDVHGTHALIPQSSLRCPEQGVIRIWFGCESEHVGFADVCARHRLDVLSGFPARCGRCSKAGRPSLMKIIRKDTH